eukprot:TRINITY_DN7935_c0_g2_i1.p1 TRINITY_DN7935_c0_g2~~TRINITY_DN7935_c0_g2_i1.p1  ORF type:complete len:412 (-),score=61.41 TRINITY_DN7935_c0_g2_i1:12-1163(-)
MAVNMALRIRELDKLCKPFEQIVHKMSGFVELLNLTSSDLLSLGKSIKTLNQADRATYLQLHGKFTEVYSLVLSVKNSLTQVERIPLPEIVDVHLPTHTISTQVDSNNDPVVLLSTPGEGKHCFVAQPSFGLVTRQESPNSPTRDPIYKTSSKKGRPNVTLNLDREIPRKGDLPSAHRNEPKSAPISPRLMTELKTQNEKPIEMPPQDIRVSSKQASMDCGNKEFRKSQPRGPRSVSSPTMSKKRAHSASTQIRTWGIDGNGHNINPVGLMTERNPPHHYFHPNSSSGSIVIGESSSLQGSASSVETSGSFLTSVVNSSRPDAVTSSQLSSTTSARVTTLEVDPNTAGFLTLTSTHVLPATFASFVTPVTTAVVTSPTTRTLR